MHTEMIQLDCDLVIEDINKIVLRAQRIMRVNLIGDSRGEVGGFMEDKPYQEGT